MHTKSKLMIAFLITILIFSGCKGNRATKAEPPLSQYEVVELQTDQLQKIYYSQGTYFNKDWDTEECTLKIDVIPNKEIAIEIANTIFKSMQTDGSFPNYTVQSVFYDEEDEIWIVSFWEDTGIAYNVSDCSIALKKSDATVLRIWVGE